MDKIKNKIRQYTTKQILDMINVIGGGKVDADNTIARAALLDVYEERNGGDAVDALMTRIGMM